MFKLGFVPVRRKSLRLDVAAEQKREIYAKVSTILPDFIQIVDVDDVCPNGIMTEECHGWAAAEKFKRANVDAIFLVFCDFGEEVAAAALAARLKLPTLVWGPRDYAPNTDAKLGRDTQCGIIAATKVLSRMDVKFSYIVSCPTDSAEFEEGFVNFIRSANIVKTMKGLRVAKFGNRPKAFMSVMANEAELAERFGIIAVPISVTTVAAKAKAMIKSKEPELVAYVEDVTSRMDCSKMTAEAVEKVAALKLAIQALMLENDCACASMECWSAFADLLGAVPCLAIGELADCGLPAACEGDLNGAITLAILKAASLQDSSQFFADLTIRHPDNDNAELLWHCGPFPYSLRQEEVEPRLDNMMCRWKLRKGIVTICRFDSMKGEYYLFAGKGQVIDGPETTGTYAWLEVDDWKKWEEKLVFGPYIHHVAGSYGHYVKAIRDAARYLNVKFDDPNIDRVYSL